eukprot:3539648-Alexandrium_andersonii.AAC.1
MACRGQTRPGVREREGPDLLSGSSAERCLRPVWSSARSVITPRALGPEWHTGPHSIAALLHACGGRFPSRWAS